MKALLQGVVCVAVVCGAVAEGQQGLPDEAKVVVEKLERELQEIQKKADEEAKALKEKHVSLLKELQDKYAKDGKLDEAVAVRDFVKNLQMGYTALPAPANLEKYNSNVGESFYFEVMGASNGYVYGSDLYAANSSLAAAAVHAGAVNYGEKGIIKVTMLPGAANYLALTRNGVPSLRLTSYTSSFRVERARKEEIKEVKLPQNVEVLAAPINLFGYANEAGKVLYFKVTGSNTGSVWGVDIYTAVSNLAAAAVHAGLLKPNQTGIIKVTILPTIAIHTGSSRNGISTSSFGPYTGSYKMELVKE